MLDLDQILSKEQKKALKKHFNNPETKAREKRMNALEKKLSEKRMKEDANQYIQEVLDRAQRRKDINWIIRLVILAFIIFILVTA
jgi:uncharacterized membrane protein